MKKTNPSTKTKSSVITPITAWAVVKKKNPKIIVADIFKDKNVDLLKTEKIIKVKIECLEE